MSNREEIDAGIEIIELESEPLKRNEDMDALEQQRIQKRRQHMADMRRKKRQQELFRSWSLIIAAGLIVLALAVWGLIRLIASLVRGNAELPDGESGQYSQETSEQAEDMSALRAEKGRQHVPPEEENISEAGISETDESSEGSAQEQAQDIPPQETELFIFNPEITDHTAAFPEEGRGVYSTNGILIDVETEEILACREPYQRINPASMTKVLTLLVAAEHVTDLEDTFIMTSEIADYAYRHDCSIAGFGVGEAVTVEELMYGTILPSGADAAMALAEYVAGSQEAFVEMMNQKLGQLGMSDTAHFTNCVGLYNEDHYCTVYDMALILKAATDNELCRKVMSARTYNTSVSSEQQPEGILLSNWFLRRIEDKDTHGEVLCAKTGFVDQSGSCAASLAADYGGREYICVTTGSISSWACIYDHVELYQAFLPPAQE
ncbi:MAG: serine hydrolase [Acetatifactor sp.]|nr:serine hydrolase [Acetatifactor sp.]